MNVCGSAYENGCMVDGTCAMAADYYYVFPISSIVSGHMDGYLHVVGLDGYRRHTLSAHIKPISVLRCTGGRIVSGGYDGMIVIHRMADLERERTITVHNGHNVTSLAIDTVSH